MNSGNFASDCDWTRATIRLSGPSLVVWLVPNGHCETIPSSEEEDGRYHRRLDPKSSRGSSGSAGLGSAA